MHTQYFALPSWADLRLVEAAGTMLIERYAGAHTDSVAALSIFWIEKVVQVSAAAESGPAYFVERC